MAVAEWLRSPLVPITLSLAVPLGVPLVVVTVRLEVPEALSGEKLAVAFEGKPVALSDTVPLKSLTDVTCTE
jgi:hypothetical protein